MAVVGRECYLQIQDGRDVSQGCHQWKVRFLKPCSMAVGIAPGRPSGWWYDESGRTYNNTDNQRDHISGPHLKRYAMTDVIVVRLDMDARTLAFAKNDGPLTVAFHDIPTAIPILPSAKISGMDLTRHHVLFTHETEDDPEGGAPPEQPPASVPEGCSTPAASGNAGKANRAATGKAKRAPPCHDPTDQRAAKSPAGPPPDPRSEPKPAWVQTAGRLLQETGRPSLWRQGHAPLFLTKRGSCIRCECLPCANCDETFQSIRDIILPMLDPSEVPGYSIQFMELKKNGDVKVDLHRRRPRQRPQCVATVTVNTCCHKHTAETCRRLVKTLKEHAWANRPDDERQPDAGGQPDDGDVPALPTPVADDPDDGGEADAVPNGGFGDDGGSSVHTSDASHTAHGGSGVLEDFGPGTWNPGAAGKKRKAKIRPTARRYKRTVRR
jgi:hypothetical protein